MQIQVMKTRSILAMVAALPVWLAAPLAAGAASESHTKAVTLTVDDLSGAVPRTGKASKKMKRLPWEVGVASSQAISQPVSQKDLYPASADANADIAAALRQASATRRHVLIDFGANWCFDCHVLDDAFHSAEIVPVLNRNFVIVHVDVGEFNKNLELAEKYGVPLKRGIPALAILDSHGKLLFSQKQGEFEKARSLAPEDILAFLNKWKPSTR